MDQARVPKRHSIAVRLNGRLHLPCSSHDLCFPTRVRLDATVRSSQVSRPHLLRVISFRMMHRNSRCGPRHLVRGAPASTLLEGLVAFSGRLGGVDGCRVDTPLAPCRIGRASVDRTSLRSRSFRRATRQGRWPAEQEGQDGRRKGPLSHSPSMGQVTLPSHHPQRMNCAGPDHEPGRLDVSDFSALPCLFAAISSVTGDAGRRYGGEACPRRRSF